MKEAIGRHTNMKYRWVRVRPGAEERWVWDVGTSRG